MSRKICPYCKESRLRNDFINGKCKACVIAGEKDKKQDRHSELVSESPKKMLKQSPQRSSVQHDALGMSIL